MISIPYPPHKCLPEKSCLHCLGILILSCPWFSDDFRGNRSYLISLNSPNISSKIWKRSLIKCTLTCMFRTSILEYWIDTRTNFVAKLLLCTVFFEGVYVSHLFLDSTPHSVFLKSCFIKILALTGILTRNSGPTLVQLLLSLTQFRISERKWKNPISVSPYNFSKRRN